MLWSSACMNIFSHLLGRTHSWAELAVCVEWGQPASHQAFGRQQLLFADKKGLFCTPITITTIVVINNYWRNKFYLLPWVQHMLAFDCMPWPIWGRRFGQVRGKGQCIIWFWPLLASTAGSFMLLLACESKRERKITSNMCAEFVSSTGRCGCRDKNKKAYFFLATRPYTTLVTHMHAWSCLCTEAFFYMNEQKYFFDFFFVISSGVLVAVFMGTCSLAGFSLSLSLGHSLVLRWRKVSLLLSTDLASSRTRNLRAT